MARMLCFIDPTTVRAPKPSENMALEIFILHGSEAADHRTFSLAQATSVVGS